MRCLIIVLAASLALPASAAPDPGKSEPRVERVKAKPVKAKRPVARKDKGYGFLPGYDPPERADLYGDKYSPYPRYWSRGDFRYGWGGPRFYRGQWNGGSFGPCWTQTPAGPVWNCGK
ncbi:MAG: hypothetical protein WA418_08925 [Bradyrhizobium sp.]